MAAGDAVPESFKCPNLSKWFINGILTYFYSRVSISGCKRVNPKNYMDSAAKLLFLISEMTLSKFIIIIS